MLRIHPSLDSAIIPLTPRSWSLAALSGHIRAIVTLVPTSPLSAISYPTAHGGILAMVP